jgi:D-xylose transport system substrate-binding protein
MMNYLKVSILALGTAALVAGAGISAAVAQTVGISWANFQEERWTSDKAVIEAAFAKKGITVIDSDAQSSVEKQNADIENLITRGIDFLIVVAQDTEAVVPAVNAALAEGIPVMGYDRLIESTDVLYTSFDNVEVGRMQAREVFALVPKGNYVFIKGNPADPNAHFVHGGQLEILQGAIDSGDIKVVGDQFTDAWVPATAQSNMENILTAADNNVDAVVVSNDGMAGGVVAALTAVGLEGIPVSGQDGDFAALNRVAQGTQTVSVWKDVRELARESADWIVHVLDGGDPADFAGVVTFETPVNKFGVNAFLIAPTPILQGNLDVVVDAGHITKDVLCEGITGGPSPCN